MVLKIKNTKTKIKLNAEDKFKKIEHNWEQLET